MRKFCKIHTVFWQKTPALYYSFFPFLALFFQYKTPFALTFLPLLAFGQPKKKVYLGLILFFAMLIFMQKFYYLPASIEAEALFFVEKEEKKFQEKSYHCYLKKFSKGNVHSRAKLSSKTPLQEGCWYSGTVQAIKYGQFYSLTALSTPKLLKKSSFFFMQKKTKAALRKKIEFWYPKAFVKEFMVSLLIGEKTSAMLSSTFQRVGCSHLLAISGFHFGLIAFFAHLLISPFFSLKPRTLLLIFTLFFYLLFVGCSSSALRAFIFFFVFALSSIFERKNSALNTLGVALGISICLAPLKVLDIGFELSFLATAAILLFYPPLRTFIVGNSSNKLFRFCLDAIALNLAVHLALLPVMFAIFHELPIHSFIYNLFFPQLTAISLLAFFSFLLAHPLLFFLTPFLHKANQGFTFFYLQFAEKQWIYEKDLFIEKLSPLLITFSFWVLYILAIFSTKIRDGTKEQ